MNTALDMMLKAKHGKILPRNLEVKCDSGWYDIINSLLTSMSNYIRMNNPQVKLQIVEIKEKFGLLRVQYGFKDIPDLRIDGMVRAICDLSATICEVCGSHHATLSNGDFRKTLCKNCKGKLSK